MELILIVSAIGLLVCVTDWRKGLLLVVVVGFMQELMRKLVPGQPVYLTATSGVVMMATLLGCLMKGYNLSLKEVSLWRSLKTPIQFFLAYVIVQAIRVIVITGSPILAGIGLLGYLSPIISVTLGYHFFRSEVDLSGFLKTYALFAVFMVGSIYLAYLGYNHVALEPLGKGLRIYPVSGGYVDLLSGFFRSPEVSGWHAAMTVMVLSILYLCSPGENKRMLYPFLIILCFGGVVLSGRRKDIVGIVLFLTAFGSLIVIQRGRVLRLVSFIILTGFLTAGTLNYYMQRQEKQGNIFSYVNRPYGFQDTFVKRLETATVDSFRFVVARNGFFGAGVGMGSQGAQYFGAGQKAVGGSAEGGLGKMLAEMGVPGILLALWIVLIIGNYLTRFVVKLRETRGHLGILAAGYYSIIVVNALVYVVAHQIYGDPFVLFLLGVNLGFLLGIARLIESQRAVAVSSGG